MPTRTERQEAADALEKAFIVNLIANIEAEQWDDGDWDDADSSSDSSNSGSSSSGWTSSSSSCDGSDLEEPTPAENYVRGMAELYSEHYLNERRDVPKSRGFFHLLLNVYKHERPEYFRSYLRINPDCFDALVDTIRDDEVFHNNSNNSQMPVEEQVAIALYRFGHHGNSASTLKVSLLFGVGFGTVRLVTSRVIKACCSDRFRDASVQWASPEAKEIAKQWVENVSCPAWRNGWLMVDGTLIPLFQRPAFYGNTWFDRKSNYSLNVQLISTPDLQIIDFGVGLPGSQHDSTAWEETRVPQQRDMLLEPDEWVWADCAYPLQKWCQAPYKKPEKNDPDNAKFNFHVSTVRIRSEHCVGFLKGRWSSLRGLRVAINGEKGLQYASLWIVACINLHAFAMKHEDGNFISRDHFYKKGKKYRKEQKKLEKEWRKERRRVADENEQERDADDDVGLLEGRLMREELKEKLFEYIQMED